MISCKKDMALKLCQLNKSIKQGTFVWEKHAENVHQELIPGPFLILLSNPKQPFHARNSFTNQIFWKKALKKIALFFFQTACYPYVNQCHSYVTCMYSYVIRIYSYVILMSLVCTRMSFVCHSYVLLPWTHSPCYNIMV